MVVAGGGGGIVVPPSVVAAHADVVVLAVFTQPRRVFDAAVLVLVMLLVFVCLITFGEWYKMLYRNNELTLDAKFSLIIIYFENTDHATGETEYNHYLAPKFASLCRECSEE